MKEFFKNIGRFFISKTFLKNLGIAIVVVVALLWASFKFISVYTRHGETVDVPNFVDQKISGLDAFISGKNVGYEIIDSIYDPKKPGGQVVRQDPDPGIKVKQGRTIYLFVTSTVPPKIACPKLEELSARAAMAVAESYGLIPSMKTKKADCNGCVIQQLDAKTGKRIEPGTPIEKGTKIIIVVGENANDGGGEISVPDLIGLSFRQARSRLGDLGLDLTAVPDVTGRFDTLSSFVYRQQPGPHSERMLSAGSSVDLYLTHDKSKLGGGTDSTGTGD